MSVRRAPSHSPRRPAASTTGLPPLPVPATTAASNRSVRASPSASPTRRMAGHMLEPLPTAAAAAAAVAATSTPAQSHTRTSSSPAASSRNVAADSARYVLRLTGKAWQVTCELREQLLATGAWALARNDDQAAHLLLADRGRVNWAREMVARRAPAIPLRFQKLLPRNAETPPCMVNVYRGCNELSNKSALVKTMRQYAAERGMSVSHFEYLPATFVLRAGDKQDERQLFLDEFARVRDLEQQERVQAAESASSAVAPVAAAAAAAASPSSNVWILKANRGAKGSAIFVSDDAAKLIAYVDAQGDPPVNRSGASPSKARAGVGAATTRTGASSGPKPATPGSLAARAPPLRARTAGRSHQRTQSLAAAASDSWVLQRYISSPFLIHGRKFDIRCWVLLDSKYRAYLYRQGVCRTSSMPYATGNWEDMFVHLTNHCIQENHPDFSKGEQGNELFFPQLQAYLDSLPVPSPSSGSPLPPHPLCVLCHLLPQLRAVVSDTLGAVRVRMECTGDYVSWQLFGYDLMLDERFHVRLLEINATPASAQALLKPLVAHLRGRAIETVFPSGDPAQMGPSGAVAGASPLTARAMATAAHAHSSVAAPTQPRAAPFSAAAVLARPCHCATILRGASKAEFIAPADPNVNLFDLVA